MWHYGTYCDKSDSFEMTINTDSGKIVPHNPEKNIYYPGKTRNVQVPYAFKLFLQEMYSMGISCKLFVEN